ncbi:MAG: class I SAM-dependent methyltransferase [Mycobacterium sp.]
MLDDVVQVGADARSVVRWLSQRVGSAGRALAADVDLRFLRDISAQNVEIRRCDINQDPIELSSYDLVHARSVLTHLRDPVAVLRSMAAALRPGGWLMSENTDSGTLEAADPAHPFAAAFQLLRPGADQIPSSRPGHGSLPRPHLASPHRRVEVNRRSE